MKQIRCAIYTRKSSDEGLEQSFNSLDAQREACAAYILSQASEGWTGMPDLYDDGGLSGGTLERPALQRLLADIAAGRIDIIVVYKVDRLTRSLLDFSRLVEAFDAAGTSFVSVTQSFNTTTSMGRLTLNMLLSFAQFEREVTAERIRDKIAASKAKGMWMGGTPPIGYEPDGRSLKIVEEHASVVRAVFDRYLELGNVRQVAAQLARDRISSPRRHRIESGAAYGGVALSRGQIYSMLKYPTYVGEILHRGETFKGLHPPIIERDTWDRVQLLLAEHQQGRRTIRSANASLLAGKLVDGEGEPLIAVHATKGSVRYRYYVSRRMHHDPGQPGMRLPAREIESAVCTAVAGLFVDPLELAERLALDIAPDRLKALIASCAEHAAATSREHRAQLAGLVREVRIHDSRIEIACDAAGIAGLLDVECRTDAPATLSLISNIRLTRSGRVLRLVQANGAAVAAKSDPSAIALLLKARAWWTVLKEGELDIKQLAAREQVNASYVTRIVRLAFLSPRVIDAVLAGACLPQVSGRSLTETDAIAVSWDAQERTMLPGAA